MDRNTWIDRWSDILVGKAVRFVWQEANGPLPNLSERQFIRFIEDSVAKMYDQLKPKVTNEERERGAAGNGKPGKTPAPRPEPGAPGVRQD